ncbi:hypothetical protein KC332_g16033 [Hortaea werneckii]|uniref:Zinc finger PHD-type domain-containing protein n=1 Tax=Hortaea werneckii EXF-2000 TaxID=1157616 RepID=A0A1Z5TC31_HORWE|nr:hypothetical protein KC358_g16348 [Hortaea werneckii]OTA33563.1 hypothetical protein BTJ68_05245 [Hortaea werneckii EXF-2000]KAI6799836.1 hypothetical protein KC350_g15980 [Hortaea werneckii]KAI6902230.1 hypothetical protein KC348_g16181 [Hortaea werneckii]KAI6921074.1 hypothetical protein KC341_g16174 [Hortaea werneckii]
MSEQKRLAGKSALYYDLASRSPLPYLPRNLSKVLDTHDSSRGELGNRPTAEKPPTTAQEPYWDYPKDETLAEPRRSRPTLRIDALQLRLIEDEDSHWWHSASQPPNRSEPSWLPDPSDDFRLPCQVHVSVSDTRVSAGNRRPTFSASQQGTIVLRESRIGSKYYEVVLDQPVSLAVEQLYIPSSTGGDKGSEWKRLIGESYSLETSIRCLDSDDTCELLATIERHSAEKYQGAPPSEGILRATWSGLPHCPQKSRLLLVRRAQGHRSLELNHGMAMDMSWSKNQGSPLEMYNRRQSSKQQQQQLPTPNGSEDLEMVSPPVEYRIRYTFLDSNKTRAQVYNGLHCIWCSPGNLQKPDSAAYKSLDRLMLHFATHHDHFRCEVNDRRTVENQELVNIVLSLADRSASHVTREKPATEEYSWVAPRRPFDISAHVNGDQSWIAGARSKAKRGPGRPPRSREDTEGSAIAMPTVKGNRKRPSVENVQDVPEQRRRKFSDPQVQGVTFYHALSKQRIHSGETLSESEDESYDDRLIHSQRQAFKQLGLSKAEAAFHEAFNRHMDAEQPSSTILLREAIVRFARKNCVSLVDAVWLSAFEAKLKHLQAHRVIGDDLVAFCLEMRPTIQQRRKYGKHDALNGDGDSENVGIDGDGDTEMEDSVMQASPPERQRGANGRFTRSPNAGPSLEETSSANGVSDRRQEKAHKWVGGGADREIVKAGRAASANGRSGSPIDTHMSGSINSSDNDTHSREAARAKVPVVFKKPHIRPEQGKATLDGDEAGQSVINGVPGASTEARPGTVRTSEGGDATSSAAGGKPLSSRNDRAQHQTDVPSIAYRLVQYRIASESPIIKTTRMNDFLYPNIGKPLDEITVDDLDYTKFVTMLKIQLGYQPGIDMLISRDPDGCSLPADNEDDWRNLLRTWERAESPDPILFKLTTGSRVPRMPSLASSKGAEERATEITTPGLANGQKSASLEIFGSRPPFNREEGGPAGKERSRTMGCDCGKPAEGGRDCIVCDNPVCKPGVFHLACVGLERRTIGWYCSVCSAREGK